MPSAADSKGAQPTSHDTPASQEQSMAPEAPAVESKGKEVSPEAKEMSTGSDSEEPKPMDVTSDDAVKQSVEHGDNVQPSSGGASDEQAPSHLQAPSSSRADRAEASETNTATDEHDFENKDKGTGSTTLTSQSQTPSHARSSKRKGYKSSSVEGPPGKRAATAEGSGKQRQPGPRRSKGSFLSKLMRRLVPCVNQSRGHPIDIIPADVAGTSEQKRSGQALSTLSKETETTTTNGALRDQSVRGILALAKDEDTKEVSEVSQSVTASVSLVVPAVVIPPATVNDEDVVQPPTPKKTAQEALEALTSGGVQLPGSTGDPQPHAHDAGEDSDHTSFTEDEEDVGVEDAEDEEDRLIMNGGVGIPIGPDGVPRPLLPPIAPQHVGRKCLVLDLDETLVHSSFKSIQQADYVVPVEIEYHWHNVYVIKRPGVDSFLKKMGEIYEVVVFTASLSKYADPVLDKLDINQVVSHRLFRESCYNHKGNYVKDLSQLGRPMTDTIILDNSPASYIFHPNNAVPVSSWFNDPHDTELTDLCPFLADLSPVDDVRGVLDGGL